MLLAVDIGNSNISFGLFENNKLISQYRLISDLNRDHESYAIDIVELLLNDGFDCLKISDIIIGSVVPDLTKVIELALQKFYGGKIFIVDNKNADFKIDSSLKKPEEIGIDRLINAKIAYKKFGSDLIIVDFGTATTFDIVGNNGQYLGGVIAPGVNLSIKALHDMTAKLPNISLKEQENIIGKSTKEAMNSGIYFGYISLIEGLIEKIKHEYQHKMQVITTGGLSSLFAQKIKQIDHIESDLTLEGLKLLFQEKL